MINIFKIYKQFLAKIYYTVFEKNKFLNAIFSILFIFILLYFFISEFYIQQKYYELNLENTLYIFVLLIYIFLAPVLIFSLNKKTTTTNKLTKYLYLAAIIFYYLILFLIIEYALQYRHPFDFYFFWYNAREVLQTVILVIGKTTFFAMFSAGIIAIISLICFLKNLKQIKTKKYILISLFLILLYIPIVNIDIRHKPFMIELAEKIFSKQKNIIKNYNKKYSALLNHYSDINESDFILPNNEKDIDIYFIHLESINSLVVNKNTMPKLLKYSDKYGVRFNNFLSNSTQTIRAEESVLCSMPPIIAPLKHGVMKNIICLPKILKSDGYKTIFFKSHDLAFSDTGEFMKKIGFSENHNKDIMRKDDPELHWGYREDIFYKRISEYLEKYKNNKKFIYIATSGSGHIPFEGNDQFDKKLPFENDGSLYNAISNSAYIQDYYLSDFLKKLVNDKRKKYVFIYSDNSHPIYLESWEEHKAYKENFSIPFVFLSINDKNNIQQGKIVNSPYSQIDIFSTLLDLLDIKMKNEKYISNSFYNELINKTEDSNQNCILSIQPFGDQYFSFFINHDHYIYNIYENKMVYYNTKTDPLEKNEIEITGQNEINEIYNKCTDFKK